MRCNLYFVCLSSLIRADFKLRNMGMGYVTLVDHEEAILIVEGIDFDTADRMSDTLGAYEIDVFEDGSDYSPVSLFNLAHTGQCEICTAL